MKFISKGYSRIFVKSELDAQYVKDWFRNNDTEEFDYLQKDTICVVSNLYDTNSFKNHLTYNGKFDGNIVGLIDSAKEKNIDILVMVCYNNGDGYYNSSVEMITSISTLNKEIELKKKIIDSIIYSIDIRGIELEDYRRNFEESGIFEEIVKLFKKD